MDNFLKTLTQEEIDAPSYMDWSDERLGQATRAMANMLHETDITGFKGIKTMAAVYVLIQVASKMNAGELVSNVNGWTDRNNPDAPTKWRITVKHKS
jgi:hypothetical protein